MDNLITITCDSAGNWTRLINDVVHDVILDESPVIVWRTLGLHPDGAVEVHQTSKGIIEKFVLLKTGEELKAILCIKQHSLAQAMNFRLPKLKG